MKKKFPFLTIVGVLLVLPLLMVGIKYPSALYSPGALVKAHAETTCMECHSPFKRVPSSSCAAGECHDGPEIGTTLSVKDLHTKMGESSCLACHTDHKGTAAKITHDFNHASSAKSFDCIDCHLSEGKKAHKDNRYGTDCQSCHNVKDWKKATFSHDRFTKEPCVDCHRGDDKEAHKGKYSTNCMSCHKTDAWENIDLDHSVFKRASCFECHESDLKEGTVHEKGDYGTDCLACHTVKDWTDITFSHDRLLKKSACVDCHARPTDSLHKDAGTDCAECHTTKAWEPATFDHIKYFPLTKKHKVRCAKCHDAEPMDFKKYTCMNCHEHNTKKIRKEHKKEKVRGFYGDCLRCHRVKMKGRRYGTRKVKDSMIDD
jgi:hypothetical protein